MRGSRVEGSERMPRRGGVGKDVRRRVDIPRSVTFERKTLYFCNHQIVIVFTDEPQRTACLLT